MFLLIVTSPVNIQVKGRACQQNNSQFNTFSCQPLIWFIVTTFCPFQLNIDKYQLRLLKSHYFSKHLLMYFHCCFVHSFKTFSMDILCCFLLFADLAVIVFSPFVACLPIVCVCVVLLCSSIGVIRFISMRFNVILFVSVYFLFALLCVCGPHTGKS